MPIGARGSDDHRRYRSIYRQFIAAPLRTLGYEVFRADDVQESGDITRDIIEPLATADLVVADLSGLNPNVFYELGARHALRGRGTIMVMDESRTPHIPFDLQAFRVIRFQGDVDGIDDFHNQLIAFVNSLAGASSDRRDNPVHAYLPTLPIDAVTASRASDEGQIRADLDSALREVQHYRRRYGDIEGTSDTFSIRPLSVVSAAIAQKESGTLLYDLVRSAVSAAHSQDVDTFLQCVRSILERSDPHISADDARALAAGASMLGFEDVAAAIFDHALEMNPRSQELKEEQLRHYAHSPDPTHREHARRALAEIIGLRISEDAVHVPDKLTDNASVGLMLDAYHRDGLTEEELRITGALLEKFPETAAVLRAHARAQEDNDQWDLAVETYIRAVTRPDATEVDAVWFGNALHNHKRYVDALESYALAAIRDPDDATAFTGLLLAAVRGRRQEIIKSAAAAPVPAYINAEFFATTLRAAFACRFLTSDDLRRALTAAEEAENMGLDGIRVADVEEYGQFRVAGSPTRAVGSDQMTLVARVEFAKDAFTQLASRLSGADIEGARGA